MTGKKTSTTPAPENDKQPRVFESLLSELEEHNNFFDDLVDMLPANLYINGPTGDEMYNPKFKKGTHKESKDARKARNKLAKLAKFDPLQSETTLEMKQRKDQESDSSEDEDESDSDSENENENGIKATSKTKVRGNIPKSKLDDNDGTNGNNGAVISRIEALRAKLHAKIAEKQQANRPTPEKGSISKRAARRAEKQRRIAAAKKKKGAGHSSANQSSQRVSFPKDGSASQSAAADDISGIDFGSIAGLKQLPQHLDNKALNPTRKRKSLEQLLADAEKKRQRLKELKASSSQEHVDKASQMEWSDAFASADGQVRKDPEKIKKAMKRREKKKAKSTTAWKSRLSQQDEKISEKQKIRNHNLTQRKKGGVAGSNLSSKRIKDVDSTTGEEINKSDVKGDASAGGKRRRMGPHSGKGRAGFEGKKQDFINKKGGSSQ
mmetsp:Transcript_52113/g.62713  ORF Transcript_52113/g.62713 Transcript_52113/m.62713 type:complete len:437 (+) Transcript_52113:38-1348(+)